MAGYKPQGTIYNLHFTGEEYDGLEIKMRGMTLGRLSTLIKAGFDTRDPAKNMEVFDFFASRIVEWNVVHPEIDNPAPEAPEMCATCGLIEGSELPRIGQSMLCLDMVFIMRILKVWTDAVASVAVPKEMNMPVGERIERALANLQTEALQTLPTPSL